MGDLSPDALYEVLADGWSYGSWVVGTKEIRDVDDTWPAVGSCIHYTVGVGPLTFRDLTTVRAVRPGRQLVLEARGWPAGTVGIRLDLDPAPDGGTRVAIREEPERGIAARLHNPLTDLLIRLRNVLTLRRLARVARRSAGRSPATARVSAGPASPAGPASADGPATAGN